MEVYKWEKDQLSTAGDLPPDILQLINSVKKDASTPAPVEPSPFVFDYKEPIDTLYAALSQAYFNNKNQGTSTIVPDPYIQNQGSLSSLSNSTSEVKHITPFSMSDPLNHAGTSQHISTPST